MNNNSLQPFAFEGAEVRTVLIDNEPWFVASDVAQILGYSATSAMTRRLDEDDKGVRVLHTLGGSQEMTIITEPGLYVSVLGSNVDGAKKFKRWVTREVLPAIRKTGSYGSSHPAELTRSDLARMVLESESEKLALSSKLEIAEPKAEYVDKFVADNDTHLFRSVASTLNVGEMELRWALVYTGWIYHDQQRRRNSKNEMVTEHLWSEFSHKKPYFSRRMNHQAALFRDNVFYQLRITTPGVAAVMRHVNKILEEHGTLKAALPALETRYNEKKAS